MLAFTFPGQGSQRPGMGAAWVDHPSFDLVDQAEAITGRDVSSLLLRAELSELTKTTNAQLATFVQSLVILDAAERLGIEPTACAGHSLGEYTALVASGALGYEDALRLVTERGDAMLEAAVESPGTMAAVLGLDDDGVQAACQRAEGEVWVANYNAPGQVVIAGTAEAVAAAGVVARELGARKILPIPVGGAFHTPLMAPARERLRKALAEVSFHDPEPVVVANVDAREHPAAGDWAALLSSQLLSPVRWRQSLDTLYRGGARTFVEIGPGGVLSGLVRRSLRDPEVLAVAVASPDDLERLVEAIAGSGPLEAQALERHGERFSIAERLVVAKCSGIFSPAPDLAHLGPNLEDASGEPIRAAVGDLIGTIGGSEVRTAFAGTVEGLLVLDGERVTAGQPVAWLRADAEDKEAEWVPR